MEGCPYLGARDSSRGGDGPTPHESGHSEGHNTGVLDDWDVGRLHPEPVVGYRGPAQAVWLYTTPGNARGRLLALQQGGGVDKGHALAAYLPRWGTPRKADAGARCTLASTDTRRAHVRPWNSHVHAGQRSRSAPNLRRAVAL